MFGVVFYLGFCKGKFQSVLNVATWLITTAKNKIDQKYITNIIPDKLVKLNSFYKYRIAKYS